MLSVTVFAITRGMSALLLRQELTRNPETPTQGCSSTRLLTDANSAQDLNLPLLSSGLLQLGSSQWESVLQGCLLAMLTLDLPHPGSSVFLEMIPTRLTHIMAAGEYSAI